MNLSSEIIHFFQKQGCVILSTIDENGFPHSSCKGIIEIRPNGQLYLLDLYHGATYKNIIRNPQVGITAVNEHRFKGYCLQGKARIAPAEGLGSHVAGVWEDKIISRITQRVLKNVTGEKGHPRHPEALLPKPKYLIAVKVKRVLDLTPQHLKQENADNG